MTNNPMDNSEREAFRGRVAFENALKKTDYRPTAHEADAMYNGWLLHQLHGQVASMPTVSREETEVVDNKTLGAFLDKVGFSNSCCGCHNDSYELEKPFSAYFPHLESRG